MECNTTEKLRSESKVHDKREFGWNSLLISGFEYDGMESKAHSFRGKGTII
jgi:hypothetical protein